MTLARKTWKYDNVYFAARKDSSCASPDDKVILYGLFRDTEETSFDLYHVTNIAFCQAHITLVYL